MENQSTASECLLQIEDEAFFAALRAKEYKRLDLSGHQIYFDYTGGNLYPASLVESHCEMLLNGTFGNPHSINPTSARATSLVEAAREKVISFFNAGDYICVFTQNASGALKIVGESYPFEAGTPFVILSDNHNSVNGIRSFCNKKQGITEYVPVRFEDLRIDDEILRNALDKNADYTGNKLFAMPAQSNVSGVKHDLAWINYAQSKGYDVLLDAAAFVPTSRLDLKAVQPEFVSISFYKIFGYPTGLGCLLIKKSAFSKLSKPWFAGGTVDVVSVCYPFHTLEEGHERFEDGTINYLNIPSLKLGLEFIESIGIDRINKRVTHLTAYLLQALTSLRHKNGNEVVHIFGPKNIENRGGTIIMTFKNADGKILPFDIIEAAALKKNISLRTGCFCNPGIDEINSQIASEELKQFYLSKDFKVQYKDLLHLNDKVRGATRISVGIATNEKDIIALLDFIKSYFEL